MPRESTLKRLLFDCGTRDVTASTALAVLRAATGLMMLFGHGLPKLANFHALSASWYVPPVFPLAWMSPQASLVATLLAEVLAAGLLVAGLLTRPAAFLLGFAMVVAAFGVHGGHVWVDTKPWLGLNLPSKEMALLYLIPALTLLLGGGGAWSLDAVLYQARKRRHW